MHNNPLLFGQAFLEVPKEQKLHETVFEKLRTFLAVRPEHPIKRLKNGEEFDPKDFPINTIIRYARDAEGTDYVLSDLNWGMVVQNINHEDVAISYKEPYLMAGVKAFSRTLKREIEVGKITHRKRDNYQHLERYRWLEIWKFGTGLRERVSEKLPNTGLLRRA